MSCFTYMRGGCWSGSCLPQPVLLPIPPPPPPPEPAVGALPPAPALEPPEPATGALPAEPAVDAPPMPLPPALGVPPAPLLAWPPPAVEVLPAWASWPPLPAATMSPPGALSLQAELTTSTPSPATTDRSFIEHCVCGNRLRRWKFAYPPAKSGGKVGKRPRIAVLHPYPRRSHPGVIRSGSTGACWGRTRRPAPAQEAVAGVVGWAFTLCFAVADFRAWS
jgi:hypothetical protein